MLPSMEDLKIYGDFVVVYKSRTEEQEQAYKWAQYCLQMRNKDKSSRLWRMRAKQALKKLEELYGIKV